MSPREEPPTVAFSTQRRGVSALSVLALIVALAALGLAGWAAFRPAAESLTGSGSRTGGGAPSDATKTICAAVELVRQGVSLNSNLQPAGGPADVTGAMAAAANARVAFSGGGQYLLSRLDPSVPQELAEDVRQFANTLLDIGAASIAGALNTDPDQAARLSSADALNAKIVSACPAK